MFDISDGLTNIRDPVPTHRVSWPLLYGTGRSYLAAAEASRGLRIDR